MARTISGISQPIGVGDPFFIDGKAYYSTPTSINTLDDKSLAEYQSQGKQIPNLTPEESDTFFKYLLSSSASSQPFAVNSYRDLRLSQDQYQGYLSGQQVGTPDLIRADLGQTVNPAGKTEAQGAPLYYGDPKAEAERQRNAAAPAISPRYETYQTSKGVVDTNGNVVGSAQAGSSPQPSLMEGTSYTVKPGDTLSAIAKQLGVPMASITGYRSGNPNLIYPGEKLSIAGTGMMGGGMNTTPQTGETGVGTSGMTDGGLPPPSVPPPNAPKTPSPGDFTKTYTDTLNQLGISSIKSQFDKVNKEFEVLQNELNDKIVEINDNPWISEGLRVERIRKEEERYEGKLNIKSNQLKLYDSLYQQGLAEARYLTTGEVANQQFAYEQAQKAYEAAQEIIRDTAANKYKNIKEIQGGLYDLENETWVLPPQDDNGDYKPPTSYLEWELAGGQKGTGKTYAEFLNTAKPATVDQAKANQFAVSAQQANSILNTSNYQLGSVEFPIPNAFKSPERQQFEQAARQFVNAVLRRESGATITDDEFKNKYKELIPAAGDSSLVLAQKQSARNSAVQSIQAAGTDQADNILTDDEAYELYLQQSGQ